MRALTLTQPWCGLVAGAAKRTSHVLFAAPADGRPRVKRLKPECGYVVACSCGWQRETTAATYSAAKQAHRTEHTKPLALAKKGTCRDCGEIKPVRRMSARRDAGNICKRCLSARASAWKAAHPETSAEQQWRSHLRKRYGITVEQHAARLSEQGHRCAVCREEFDGDRRHPRIDHDHATGVFRGVLCHACNVSLGLFNDNPTRLRRAADYLEGRCAR